MYKYEIWNLAELIETSKETFNTLDECIQKANEVFLRNPDSYHGLDFAYINITEGIIKEETDVFIPDDFQRMIDSIKTEKDLNTILEYLDNLDDDSIDWNTNVEIYSMAYRRYYRN